MDYEAVNASLTFTEMNSSVCFDITIEDDDVAEAPEECFNVVLSNPGPQPNLILMPQVASVCILENDGMLTCQTMHALKEMPMAWHVYYSS